MNSFKLNDQTFLLEKILYGKEGVPGNLEYTKALLQRLFRVRPDLVHEELLQFYLAVVDLEVASLLFASESP